ncbi:MAG: Crp/Fnr family transcriptional regulator [Acidobacteriota bacterium]|nr:Crp/Fnr family transcriptional regulator [Acidobacteriota bacterium]
MAEALMAATTNRLLSLLNSDERERLLPDMRHVTLNQGDVIFREEERINEVCFPDSGIVSIVCTSEKGESVEIGMVGYEGAAGLSVVLGEGFARNRRAVVQLAGSGRMIGRRALLNEFKRCGPFQGLMLRYAHAYLTTVTQSVFCQAYHRLDERLARWLLECRFRAKADELRLTHEYLAEMIGVRRAGVTEAMADLVTKGAVSQTRGVITIVDRGKLEEAACECCRIIRSEFEDLFGR